LCVSNFGFGKERLLFNPFVVFVFSKQIIKIYEFGNTYYSFPISKQFFYSKKYGIILKFKVETKKIL
jgi:hypothetical protein